MNKTAARSMVYRWTIDALRKRAPHITTGQISGNAKQGDVTKVREQIEALALMLEKKLAKKESNSEPEAGPPCPSEGPNDIPEVGDGAEPGDAPAAVG